MFQKIILRSLALLMIAGVPTVSGACSIFPEARSASEIRRESAPVAVDKSCGVRNGGVNDRLTLGPAIKLENGRLYQIVNEDAGQVLVADCKTREATVLVGRFIPVSEDSCGPYGTNAPLVGDRSQFSLDAGADLQDLVTLASTKDAREQDPIYRFFRFSGKNDKVYKVGRKDEFDLLCGCKIFYPRSRGAKS
jgi:hypothetical protein